MEMATEMTLVTVVLDKELAARIDRLAQRTGKTTPGQKEALIWWCLTRGVTVEEEWQDFLATTER